MDIRKFFGNTGAKLKRKLSPSDSNSNEEHEAQDKTTDDCHPNDIGKWIAMASTMSAEQKKQLLTDCWKPYENYNFAADAVHLKRKFNRAWLEMYRPWIVYSRRLKGAFCLHCVLFKPLNKPGIVSSFVVRPFTKYKNVHEYCKSHAASNHHKEATQSAKLFLEATPVDLQLQSGHEKIVAENRKFLKSIISTIVFCGTHDLPLRGKFNDEGILHDLIKLRISAGDEALRRHIDDGKKNATYMSPRIQNEILHIAGKIIRGYICEDLKEASTYSILADETADMAGVEQLSIGFRFFDQHTRIIREEFVGFVELMSMDAETIALNIKKFVSGMDLDPEKCVGLGFDGCATMAGKTGGVQKILKKSYPKSLYFHCASHRLNLVVNDLNSVPEIRNSVSTIKDIINFFKESVIRRKYAPNIHSFCETRWSEKYQSISDFKKYYCEIVAGLEKLSTEGNSATRKLAFQLHSAAGRSVFIVSMSIIAKYYGLLQPVVNVMQSKNNDIIKCREHMRKILNVFEKYRATPEQEFNEIFKDCEELARGASVDIYIPRVVGKQTNRTNPPSTTPLEYYRRAIFLPYLDSMISSIKQRFSEENNPAFNLTALNPMPIQRVSLDDLKAKICLASSFYNLDGIENELELWYNQWNKNKNPTDLVLAYKETDFVPKIKEALDILLALPCTTATVERSFSTLRRVKTWLRTTMTKNRLNGLCMLSAHKILVQSKKEELEEKILNEFAADPRKLAIV